jgi:hypothetical protein
VTDLEEWLTKDPYLRGVRFVAFILCRLLHKREKSLFLSILGRLAMAADHLLTTPNPN